MNPIASVQTRLTLWYTGLFVVLSLILIISINFLATRYYRSTQYGLDALSEPRFNQIFEEPIQDQIRREQIVRAIQQIRQDDLNSIQTSTWVLFLILVGLSLMGGHIIATEALHPIRDINRQIRKIKADSLGKIHYPHDDRELVHLVDSLNEMLARLGKSFTSQKQFIEHASHELKTPLSSMILQLESILAEDSLGSEDRELIEGALRKAENMANLIEDLSLLSLESEHLICEESHFEQIVHQSIAGVQPLAQEKGITIIVPRIVRGTLCVSSNLLERAMANILENAIKYSPRDTSVRVVTRSLKDAFSVAIEDRGPGIPTDQIHRIFDRFYRIDPSRSRKTGGRGLGLAITKTIMELHGGSIEVENIRRGGARFTLIIPKNKI